MKEETTQVSVLDPKEYGLESSQVSKIESAFMPKIIERNALAEQYAELLKSEITPEVSGQMGDLRRKLVKVRTGIAEIHKTQKAFYLAAGRFVDAWKNKETEPIAQMEEKLREGEEYYERLEAKRIADIADARREELSAFTEIYPESLGLLSDEAFGTYLLGAKAAYEAKLKAEKEAEAEVARQAEEARKAQLKKERDDMRFRQFAGTGLIFSGGQFACAKGSFDLLELCELSDKDFAAKVQDAMKMVAECKAEEIAEKEKLAILAAAKQKEAKAAEAARKKAEADAAAEKAKADAALKLEQEKAAAEKAKQDAIIAKQKAELEARQKQEAEAKAAEEKRIAEEKAAAELAAKAPRKEKLTAWIDGLTLTAPDGLGDDAVVSDILAKFGGFKNWATKQIEAL